VHCHQSRPFALITVFVSVVGCAAENDAGAHDQRGASALQCRGDNSQARALSDKEQQWLQQMEDCASHTLGEPVHVDHPPRAVVGDDPNTFDVCSDGQCIVAGGAESNTRLIYSPTCNIAYVAQQGLLRLAFLHAIICDMPDGCDPNGTSEVFSACSLYIDCGDGIWLVGGYHHCDGKRECQNGSDEMACK
jgi:hypothetical protein